MIVNLIEYVMLKLVELYSFLIIIWCLLSWFPNGIHSALGEFIDRLVRPYISFFDRFIPPLGGVSFSPIVGIIVLNVVSYGISAFFKMFLGA